MNRKIPPCCHPQPTPNAAKCRKCGSVIVSRHVHDFVSCQCGAIAVDGGDDYWRRIGDPELFQELTDEEQESL
jgi:hypothetical protein